MFHIGEAGHPKGKGQLDAADEKLSLTELEHLVFEAMDAMWCSKNESKETTELSLNTKDIISAFHHLSQFFLTSAEDLCEIAAERICELLGFLTLTCATVHKLFFGEFLMLLYKPADHFMKVHVSCYRVSRKGW